MSYKLTRIAPTPSGYLHLGNVFSFALTAGIARRAGASILLRIDDLDRERVQRGYLEDIFETLRFLEIPWDIGARDTEEFFASFSQVHRLSLYSEALARLRAAGAVFGCSCSRAEVLRLSAEGVYPGTCRERGLSLDAGEVAWRLRTEDDAVLRVNSFPAGEIEARLPAEMRDFVVRKKDGFPAYQLSSVVDDLHYGVDLIVRGQDLWASTLAQLYLSYPLDAAVFRDIRFYHHPLLTSPLGEKLSKSAGATSIQYLRKRGLKAADVYAMIARAFVGGDPSASPGGLSDVATRGGTVADAATFAESTAGDRVDAASAVRDWAGLAALVLDNEAGRFSHHQ